MPPKPGLLIPSATGGDDMEMGIVLPIAAMGLDHHDIAALKGMAADPCEDIIQALDTTAHECAQQDSGVLIEGSTQHGRHSQDDMAIDDTLMQHTADLAHPVIDVDFGAAETQRRFIAHRQAMGALT